jgi:uncharacterized protein YhbP (UPF0306 family)
MTREFPEEIAEVLDRYHVLSLATAADGKPWSASVFYMFDRSRLRLVFLTSLETRHGIMLESAPDMAGTIAAQPTDISLICGLQFEGTARRLSDKAADEALAAYLDRFPKARGMPAPVWAIELRYVKLTDNRRGFGHKTIWDRNAVA